MFCHLVLFRLRPDVTRAEREALVGALEVALREIPSIDRFQIGRRVMFGAGYEPGAPDLDFAAIIEFGDLAALRAYLAHPAHEPVGARFNASIEQALVYDYELMEPEEARRALVEM